MPPAVCLNLLIGNPKVCDLLVCFLLNGAAAGNILSQKKAEWGQLKFLLLWKACHSLVIFLLENAPELRPRQMWQSWMRKGLVHEGSANWSGQVLPQVLWRRWEGFDSPVLSAFAVFMLSARDRICSMVLFDMSPGGTP